jgi:hypothetical protein
MWLAKQGWEVTAVDFSAVAIDKARAIAESRGLSVTWVVADMFGTAGPSCHLLDRVLDGRGRSSGMAFLYDLRRLNVATSRARCLAILVSSSELVRVFCRTPQQIVLANALCRFREIAEGRS